MILDRSTENIREIVWSDINAVLNEIADYYLKKFENPYNIKESLLRQFEGAVTNELSGINLEDYLRTNNCSLELVAKYNKLLKIKSDFFGGFIKVVEPPKYQTNKIEVDISDNTKEEENIEKIVVTSNEEVIKEEIKEPTIEEVKEETKVEHKPADIEGYIKEMEVALKEKQEKEVIQATMDPNSTIEEIEEDYSAIAELLGDEDIVIKFKENE